MGRPNVGKSTLFNKIIGRRRAIVLNTPGITRDRLYQETSFDSVPFLLVDTGGFNPTASQKMDSLVVFQVMEAIQEADLVIFLADGRAMLTPFDQEMINLLRQKGKTTLYVANKIDGPAQEDNIYDFYRSGIDQWHTISAEHSRGVMDMLTDLVGLLPGEDESEPKEEVEAKVALIGKPNVGKSTLLNAVTGQNRVIVDSKPGTTVDSIDSLVELEGKKYLFIDTAGIRRRSKISKLKEKFSVVRALKSITNSQVIFYLLDGEQGLSDQDQRMISYIEERGKGLVILVNKWDLVKKNKSDNKPSLYRRQLRDKVPYLNHIDIHFISAKTGYNLRKFPQFINNIKEQWLRRLPTPDLNSWLEVVQQAHQPPVYRSRRIKFYYIAQTREAPPTFNIKCNYPQGLPKSYQRYLLNQLRTAFGFQGVPVRVKLQGKSKNRKR